MLSSERLDITSIEKITILDINELGRAGERGIALESSKENLKAYVEEEETQNLLHFLLRENCQSQGERIRNNENSLHHRNNKNVSSLKEKDFKLKKKKI